MKRTRIIKKVGENVFALVASASETKVSKFYDDYKKSYDLRVLLAEIRNNCYPSLSLA